jgi:hypothetical protein
MEGRLACRFPNGAGSWLVGALHRLDYRFQVQQTGRPVSAARGRIRATSEQALLSNIASVCFEAVLFSIESPHSERILNSTKYTYEPMVRGCLGCLGCGSTLSRAGEGALDRMLDLLDEAGEVFVHDLAAVAFESASSFTSCEAKDYGTDEAFSPFRSVGF